MRAIVLIVASVVFFQGGISWSQSTAQDKKDTKKKAAKDPTKATAASELTRTKLLKAKMTVNFTEATIGDVLKEFAAQVEMKLDTPVMWCYSKDFPYSQKVTYSCKNASLEVALDELFKKEGGLGYIVIGKEGDRRDGWVLVTKNGERGYETGAETLTPLTDTEKADATAKLALAKKLIDTGKNDQAKTVLAYIVKRYPSAKEVMEAKELLEKLGK